MTKPNKFRGRDMRVVEPEVHDMRAPPVKPMTEAPLPRPPDRLEPPPPPRALVARPTELPTPQSVAKVRCAYCRTEDVEQRGVKAGWRYYRCRRCCDFEAGAASTFKVRTTDPLAPAG